MDQEKINEIIVWVDANKTMVSQREVDVIEKALSHPDILWKQDVEKIKKKIGESYGINNNVTIKVHRIIDEIIGGGE